MPQSTKHSRDGHPAGRLSLVVGLGICALTAVLDAPSLSASAMPAANVTVNIADHRGGTVDEAVVTLRPADGAKAAPLESSVMDQVQEAFVPGVLVVTTGTPVHFPNHDDVRHHVYSFSDAKKFELPLYEGTPTNPIMFDQPGIVVLGCNIHDWMKGYIFVTDTPLYTISEAGVANITGVAPGTYTASVWHPRLRGEAWTEDITVSSEGSVSLDAEIRLKPALKIRRAPKAGKTKY